MYTLKINNGRCKFKVKERYFNYKDKRQYDLSYIKANNKINKIDFDYIGETFLMV